MVKALVSVYQPASDVLEKIKKISKQVDTVYICDNSEKKNEDVFKELANVHYIFNGKNLGLSVAFNSVLKEKEKYDLREDDYIFFFDQDSVILEGHIDNLKSIYQDLEHRGINVGCLGPVFFNTNRNEVEIQHAKKRIIENTYSVKSIITSSMMCRYDRLEAVGYWNEEIFLDMADWDLCWRFIQNGYLCCVTTSVVLEHTLGECEKKVGLVKLRVGKVFRDYYQVRDGLYLLSKNYTPFKFRIRIILMLTIRSLMRLVLLEKRRERFKYILQGIRDYTVSYHGEYLK